MCIIDRGERNSRAESGGLYAADRDSLRFHDGLDPLLNETAERRSLLGVLLLEVYGSGDEGACFIRTNAAFAIRPCRG